jgi:hypothetical protein
MPVLCVFPITDPGQRELRVGIDKYRAMGRHGGRYFPQQLSFLSVLCFFLFYFENLAQQRKLRGRANNRENKVQPNPVITTSVYTTPRL